jgi:Tol biopolymer transport system component
VRRTSIGADVVLFNLTNGTETVISKDYGGTGGGNAFSSFPLLSPDGRYIVFTSLASNLVPNDTNRLSDIFVHDRVQNTTVLLSRAYDGMRSGNGQSTQPVMAKDGRTVFFQSFAGDLVEGDYNERRDIFVVKLGVGDSDNDGMDDDWEVAQFGNLSRDGAGDHDGDGQTDLQEYLAGTSPTNGGSILRVMTVTPLGGGSTTVVWSAVVGRNYVVQFKDSLDATWTNASGVIEGNSTSTSFAHNSSSAQRFYRVIAVQ